MGDIADDLIQQGQDAVILHNLGQCEQPCPYCEQEEAKKIFKRGNKWFERHASGLLIELPAQPEPTEEEWEKGEV